MNVKCTTRFAELEAICRLAGAGAMADSMHDGEPGPCPKCFGARRVERYVGGRVEHRVELRSFPCDVCDSSGFVVMHHHADALSFKNSLVPGHDSDG